MTPGVGHVVFLPATAPGDTTYGSLPVSLLEFPELTAHAVYFPELVWYNCEIRAQAVAQIRTLRQFGVEHAFLSSPDRPHQWNSGWIEAALTRFNPKS